ncbi:MAG: ATP-binding protein [bacterium]
MINYDFLTIQNPWWFKKEEIEADAKIKEFEASSVKYLPQNILNLPLENGAVNIVYGPRQTGKSTAIKLLIRKLLKRVPSVNILYFNCDCLDSRRDIIDLVSSFLEGLQSESGENSPNYLFLDEISSVNDWPYAIKWLADNNFFNNSKIILTGSSSISLKKSGEFLPGRRGKGKDVMFLPINFFDYFNLFYPQLKLTSRLRSFSDLKQMIRKLSIKKINLKKDYQRFLLTGGFLKILDLTVKKEPYFDAVELYKNTLRSELAKYGKKEIHARLILAKIIASLGSETSYANVAEEAELGSKNTASEYLRFFSDSFFLVETLFYNIPQKRVILKKNKKYYPTDTFLFWIFNSFISGANEINGFYQKYLQPSLDSRIAEAFIAGELYKQGLEFYYFKDKKEIDFWIPNGELAIEVKYKDRITKEDMQGLKYGKRKIVVSKNTLEMKDDILIIPIYLFGLIDLAYSE